MAFGPEDGIDPWSNLSPRPLVAGSFSERGASCTEGTLEAYLDGEGKVVVPGNGDRVWAGCQDHEMIMAIPSRKLANVVEGLKKSYQKGVRYAYSNLSGISTGSCFLNAI